MGFLDDVKIMLRKRLGVPGLVILITEELRAGLRLDCGGGGGGD